MRKVASRAVDLFLAGFLVWARPLARTAARLSKPAISAKVSRLS